MAAVRVAIERGPKRTFATAIDHPGWSRSGRDETSALAALFAAAPRYAKAMKRGRVKFAAPREVADLKVVERHEGGSGTDFGVPSATLKDEARPAGSDLRALTAALDACRAEFDAVVAAARGKALTRGPRGGGRDLAKIVEHAVEAEAAYAAGVGARSRPDAKATLEQRLATACADLDAALIARERGELPEKGPRGGERWKARHAVRRSAWHWLDHAWEIEDRLAQAG